MRCCIAVAVAAALAAGSGVSLSLHAEPLDSSTWVEHTFGPSPTSGDEQVNGYGAPIVTPGSVVGAMPTNTTDWPHSDGGGQGFDAVEHLAATGGALVGDHSGDAGLTATFSLNNTALANGITFSTTNFGGELTGASTPTENEHVLLYFASHNVIDPGAIAFGGLSEWWYSPTAAPVTSLQNGVATTITRGLLQSRRLDRHQRLGRKQQRCRNARL